MYQCLLVAADGAASPAGTAAGAGTISGVSPPSGMFLCIVDQPPDPFAECGVGKKEINSKKSHRNRDHHGRRNHVRARRPVDVPHFGSHVVQKRTRALGPRRKLAHRLHERKCVNALFFLFSIKFRFVRHLAFCLRPVPQDGSRRPSFNLAGEEGFEPPLSVLETDGLPLNLLPYNVERLPAAIVRLDSNYAPNPGPHIPKRDVLTSLPCGPCASGTYCRTSTSPAGPDASSGSWSSCSSGSYNRCTAV